MTMTATLETTKEETNLLRTVQSADLSGQTVPRRVLIAPWGQVESTNGSFVVDEEAAGLAVAAFDRDFPFAASDAAILPNPCLIPRPNCDSDENVRL